MQDTNVKLSKEEMLLVNNSEIILTKQIIISKVYDLFALLHEQYDLHLRNRVVLLNGAILKQQAKIYKGEQYRQLPYVLMDYPRYFTKEEVFVIRSFFWWGNFFSITLHVSGNCLKEHHEKIFAFIGDQKNEEWFICVNDTPWQHDFSKENYLPVQACTADTNIMEEIRRKSFIKLARKIELTQWNAAQVFFVENFSVLIEMVAPASFQAGETVL